MKIIYFFHATFPLFPKIDSECDRWDNNYNIAVNFKSQKTQISFKQREKKDLVHIIENHTAYI